ncbi:GNAT family N-acetyltransferase [Natrialbaceae archaeon GCM10025810]|uniref:GNAT family N-acetyltransferase n=1 Tax=Halovalidus salilacus TaxID=3075124 RepID=UPI00361DB7B1
MATEETARTHDDRAGDATTERASDGNGGRTEGGDDPYEIRPYEPDDRDDFLELYHLVFGDDDSKTRRESSRWFRWKYEDNPYLDHVPMIVAVHDGRVVGTKPCFALELRAGSRTLVGLQPADVMVHEDHRRRGLYSRTTERLKEHYRDRNPSLFFNFPNPATLSGSLKHGWQIVEQVPTYYRIQHPDSMIDATEGKIATLSSASSPLFEGYLRVRDALRPTVPGVTVERTKSIPADVFVDLYRRAIPGTLHANRDETFYEWRFENPDWDYDAYVARRGDEPIAGAITGTAVREGSLVTCLTDAVPLASAPNRRDGLEAIVDRVIEDRADADLIAASGDALPTDLLERFGFHSDQSVPLSAVSQPTTQVTYPIADDGGHEWTVAGRAVADPTNWTVTYAEQDTW